MLTPSHFCLRFLFWLSPLLPLFFADPLWPLYKVSVSVSPCLVFPKSHANTFPKNTPMDLPVIFFTSFLYSAFRSDVDALGYGHPYNSRKEPHLYHPWKEQH
uniref:Putative secreted protein n=1 Tax=Ixodes ricinus TaxID=34613 RepID=A0A147BE87_IXORI